MRLGVRPIVFLGRLLVCLLLAYVVWRPVEPAYTELLGTLTRSFLHMTERTSDPELRYVTEMRVRQTSEGRPAIFFQHVRYPEVQSGIPAEWVQANLVLLIPLMLAMPAASYSQRFTRLGVALVIAVAVQVIDIAVTVKATYAFHPLTGMAYTNLARTIYGFGDAFFQSFDTQLFPVVIWAGIHFNQLLGRTPSHPRPAAAPQPRRKRKAARKLASPKVS